MSSENAVLLGLRSASRRLRGQWSVILAAALILGPCGCGSAVANTPPQDIARVDHACGVTLGLNPTEEEFAKCKASLLGSLARLEEEDANERDRAACMARGLSMGTPAFALCVLDAEDRSPINR